MTHLSSNNSLNQKSQMPTNILLEKWADVGFVWSGQVAICEFSRLYQVLDKTHTQPNLTIQLTLTKKEGILWLSYDIQNHVQLACQRCLLPITVDLSGNYTLAILYNESQIASINNAEFVFLDEVCPDNRKTLPIKDLLEDELLLRLPLSPRHKNCQLPITLQSFEPEEKADNPFLVLSQLKGQLPKKS